MYAQVIGCVMDIVSKKSMKRYACMSLCGMIEKRSML